MSALTDDTSTADDWAEAQVMTMTYVDCSWCGTRSYFEGDPCEVICPDCGGHSFRDSSGEWPKGNLLVATINDHAAPPQGTRTE